MELQIKDRLYIPAILPKEGKFNEFNLKKSILRKIEITPKEREAIDLKENPDTNRIEWDVTKDEPLHVDFNDEEMQYLKASCERISDEVLPDDMWGTVERIYDALQQ